MRKLVEENGRRWRMKGHRKWRQYHATGNSDEDRQRWEVECM